MTIYTGSTGVEFQIELGVDLTDVESVTMYLINPSGLQTVYSGEILSPATDGIVSITTDDELTEVGSYRLIPKIRFAEGCEICCDPVQFEVFDTGVTV